MANRTDIEALTQAGLNLIQQALSIYDSDLRLVVVNRTFQDMFDLPDALIKPGVPFVDTIRYLVEQGEYGIVDDPESFMQARVDQARTFEPHYMERTRASGRVISVEGSPLPQGGWVAVYTDITGIKRQEGLLRARSEELSEQVLAHAEELAQTNRALASTNAALEETSRQLAEMESRTRLTTEMMPAHIARLDPDLCYTFSNRKLGAVIPGRPESIVGLHAREALGDEAYAKILPYLEGATRGQASVHEFNHEGTGRRIRVALTPDQQGAIVSGVYILSMDITEEAQAREALNQTRKRELAAQLTSGLAHDFSNLLTIILGMQARLGQMGLPGQAQELVEGTTGAARRGGVLLDRIASVTGRREMHPEPTDITTLLNGLETLATPTLPAGVDLVLSVSGLSNPVMLDPGAIQDMVLNLILNARDAIGPGPGRVTINARPIRETWLQLTVGDSGPGFSPDALEHALNPFYTTKGGEGSGLGLSMVFDQAKLAGGQVRLENSVQGGGKVTLRLPLRLADASPAPRLVLLVEDTPEIRENVREMLIALGHKVIEAEGADEALFLAGIDGIGLILSDINLHGAMSGDALLARLQSEGNNAPALLMTSLPASDPRRAGAAFAVIAKPFTQGELAAFLARELSP
ncbi:MAG: PAS domain-containing protein [Rhodobacteraceae bacterium]|nr:PAS domain-containing protein [Paracoccaceae bacterium]